MLVPAVAAIALVLAACGGGNDDPEDAPFFPTGASGGANATIPAEGARATPTPRPEPSVTPATCTGSTIQGIARDNQRAFSAPPAMVIDPSKSYVATMQTTRGVVTIALAKETPITTNNFVFLSCHGFYDGLKFHRVIRTPTPFMAQGGDPQGNGSGGPGYQFQDEFTALKHETGIISMANSGPATNGSQFFITFAPQPHLDGKHTVFGRVTSGMEAVNAIQQGDTILAVSIAES